MSGLVVLAIVFGLMLVGVAVPFALGAGAFVAVASSTGIDPAFDFFGREVANLTSKYSFLAIAFFVFYGRILEAMDARVAVINLIARGRPGRALIAEVVSSLVVPDIAGEALLNRTETAAGSTNRLSLAGIPVATALRVSALLSVVRAIAPPAVLVIVLGLLMGQSTIRLLAPLLSVAGVLAVLAVVLGLATGRAEAPVLEPDKSIRGGLVWVVMAVFIPLVLFGGFVTPTEIGAFAALSAVVLAVFGLVLGWVTAQELLRAASRSLRDLGNIFLTLTFGSLIVYAFAFSGQLPRLVVELAATVPVSTVVILAMGMTVIVASLIGPFAAIVVLVPLLFPALKSALGPSDALAASFGLAAMLAMLLAPFGTTFVTLSAGSTQSPMRIAMSFGLALVLGAAAGFTTLALLG